MDCVCCCIVYLFVNGKSANCSRVNYRSIDGGFWGYGFDNWLIDEYSIFVYTGLQIPMGILADRFGPNLFLIIGATLTGIGTILYSLGTHEFILFFSRILTGVGDATIWVNMVLILAKWFHKRSLSD